MNKKGISLFAGILIFILITSVMITLIVFGYLANQKKIDKNVDKILNPDKVYFKVQIIAEDTQNTRQEANFTLKLNTSQKILYGNLYTNKVETYDRIQANETYFLYIWNYNHYMNITKLNASDSVFSGKMMPFGVPKIDIARLRDFSYILKLSSENGFFRRPLICEKHTYNILYVQIANVTEVPIPEPIKESNDHCYSLDTIDSDSFKTFNLTVVPYSLLNESDYIHFTFIDKVQFFDKDILKEDSYFNKIDLGVPNIQRTISVY